VAERLGVIRTVVLTETATALGILALVASPLALAWRSCRSSAWR